MKTQIEINETLAASNTKHDEAKSLREEAYRLDQKATKLEVKYDMIPSDSSLELRMEADYLRETAQVASNEACAIINSINN